MKDEEDEKTRRKKRQEKIKRDTMCYVCGCVLCSKIARPSNNFEFSKLPLPTLKEFNFPRNFLFVRLQIKLFSRIILVIIFAPMVSSGHVFQLPRILRQQRAFLHTNDVDLTDLLVSQDTLKSNGTCLVDRFTVLQDELPGLKRLEILQNKRFFSRPSVILIRWNLKRLSKVSLCLTKKKCNGRGSQHSNASHTGRNKASSHS